MERIFLIANVANYVVEVSLFLLATAVAWRLGGRAARLAALVNVAAWIMTTPANLLPIRDTLQANIACSLDLMTAAGFLYVAARFNSLWIAVAVLSEGLQTCVDLVYLGEGSSLGRVNHFLMGATDNVLTYIIQVAILGAALSDRRRLAPEAPVRV